MEPVSDDADRRDEDEHDRGEREGHDDLAGRGVAVGDHSQQVGKQNEGE